MNITLKNIPDEVYQQLKHAAEEQGRSLNAQIILVLTGQVAELERRRRMRESRKRLERFVASLPKTRDSSRLIREDRDRL